MTNARDVLTGRLEFHGHHGFTDQLTGHGANDVHSKNFIGFFIGQDLDHAGGVAQRSGAPVGQKRKRTGSVGMP